MILPNEEESLITTLKCRAQPQVKTGKHIDLLLDLVIQFTDQDWHDWLDKNNLRRPLFELFGENISNWFL